MERRVEMAVKSIMEQNTQRSEGPAQTREALEQMLAALRDSSRASVDQFQSLCREKVEWNHEKKVRDF